MRKLIYIVFFFLIIGCVPVHHIYVIECDCQEKNYSKIIPTESYPRQMPNYDRIIPYGPSYPQWIPDYYEIIPFGPSYHHPNLIPMPDSDSLILWEGLEYDSGSEWSIKQME